jgi:hypothetical protein
MMKKLRLNAFGGMRAMITSFTGSLLIQERSNLYGQAFPGNH